jgi:hypothetical protein
MNSAKYLYIAQMFRNQGNMVSAKYWQKRAGKASTEQNTIGSIFNKEQKRYYHD